MRKRLLSDAFNDVTTDAYAYLLTNDNRVFCFRMLDKTIKSFDFAVELSGLTVVSIGEHAFDGCSSLTSIVIPDTVISIGSDAFDGCSSLTSIIIPKGVTSIGSDAFYDCSSLTSVIIPDSVTSIGKHAFDGCSSLANVFYLGSKEQWNAIYVDNYGNDCLTASIIEYNSPVNSFNDVTTDAYAYLLTSDNRVCCFRMLDKTIKSFDFAVELSGLTVVSISYGAFYGCSSLTSITIPDSVTLIGYGAFYGCSSLTSIVIPDSVTSISVDAFRGCLSLTSIIIPKGVTSIGSSAFYGCTKLESITIPDSVTSIGYGSFEFCSSLASIIIPKGITSISCSVFEFCCSLTSIIIPDSVTSIGVNAFRNCSSLANVFYLGSKAQWNSIKINAGNDFLISANITYNYMG